SCGSLTLKQALINPDSYMLLAFRLLKRAPGTVASKETLPSVQLGNFRNTGPLSKENRCEVCRDLPGLGLDENTALNIMELRGDISGHRPNVEYDFSRTKERAIWERAGDTWTLLKYAPPKTEDNRFSTDEDVTPKNNHIYTVDGPGFEDLDHPTPDASADEAVYRGTFIDFVRARVGTGIWSKVSNDFAWHSITWLEKAGGKWRRKAGANEVSPGAIFVGKALPYGPGDYPPPAKGKGERSV
ncbi:MAG: hypothetical protein ACLPXB_01315, partial [Thiobacillaceae bacterium]